MRLKDAGSTHTCLDGLMDGQRPRASAPPPRRPTYRPTDRFAPLHTYTPTDTHDNQGKEVNHQTITDFAWETLNRYAAPGSVCRKIMLHQRS